MSMQKYSWSLILFLLVGAVPKSAVFGAVRDINEADKAKLNSYKDKIVNESVYKNVKDYATQIVYLEIVEINESNLKETIPFISKRAEERILVDKAKDRIIIRYLFDKKGNRVKLLNNEKSKSALVRYLTKYNDGRSSFDNEGVNFSETIPDVIASYKEYVPPYDYFYLGVDRLKAFTAFKASLKHLSNSGSVTLDIQVDGQISKNIEVGVNETKILESSERKIDLTTLGNLKKIELRSGYKLPAELDVKTTIYISNHGFTSVWGNPNENK